MVPSMARLTESRPQPAQHLTETTSEPSRPRLSRPPEGERPRFREDLPIKLHIYRDVQKYRDILQQAGKRLCG